MAEVIVGEVLIDVEVELVRGTQPIDVLITLIDNDAVVTTRKFVFGDEYIGTVARVANVFKITDEGQHVIYTRTIVRNPWGEDEPRDSNVLSFELIKSAIPIAIDEPWKLWYDTRAPGEEAEVAKRDFIDKGWNVVDKEAAGEGSDAAPDYNEWSTEDYHSILILSENQCPVYQGPSPYYWASFIFNASGLPGTWDGVETIYGNDGKRYNHENYALIKYFVHHGHSHALIYDNDDHYPMASDWHRTVWNYVANLRAAAYYSWYIIDKVGNVVDHE